jgi:hypothetical protein
MMLMMMLDEKRPVLVNMREYDDVFRDDMIQVVYRSYRLKMKLSLAYLKLVRRFYGQTNCLLRFPQVW